MLIKGSKSETNRLLVLQAWHPELRLINESDSDDSKLLKLALKNTNEVIDIHHAGTAMRFLTAYFSIQEGRTVILTGSERMKQRPISPLVDALRELGADIEYVENEGFPPLKIKGKKLLNNKVSIKANVSSQYITALLLLGSQLDEGLEINLKGEITSQPYIQMSVDILKELGATINFSEKIIRIEKLKQILKKEFVIESDWSSVSYFYSLLALSDIDSELKIGYYKEQSLQGDKKIVDIYKYFGVDTRFEENKIRIKKIKNPIVKHLILNLNETPDIAQTILVTCLGLGITCQLKGMHTLKIKETDRLVAMKCELEKFGAEVTIDDESISLMNTVYFDDKQLKINTYNDHRMAMSFAPLLKKQTFFIEDKNVVTKSFPDFWNMMNQAMKK